VSQQQPQPPAPVNVPVRRVRSFIGWAFLISLVLHALTVPFFHLRGAEQDKPEVEKVSVTKKIKVTPPTPPPPTPPPPTPPPPKTTPPPVKQTNPPPQPKIKLNVPKSTSHQGPATEHQYVAPPVGNENGVPAGTTNTGPPISSTAPPATPAPTPAPPTPTPRPACANPNVGAAIKGEPVSPDEPEMAKEQGATGTTEVKVTLDATGAVVSVSVYKSAGNASLDQAAMAAARATQYTPDIVNCDKVGGSYIFSATFEAQ
jgi:TonB family protein